MTGAPDDPAKAAAIAQAWEEYYYPEVAEALAALRRINAINDNPATFNGEIDAACAKGIAALSKAPPRPAAALPVERDKGLTGAELRHDMRVLKERDTESPPPSQEAGLREALIHDTAYVNGALYAWNIGQKYGRLADRADDITRSATERDDCAKDAQRTSDDFTANIERRRAQIRDARAKTGEAK